jgi:hypothetical protein
LSGEGSDPGWENPDSGKHKEGARTAEKNRIRFCAAKAFYSCPAIISQHPESQEISKEPQENTEEESKII